MSGAFSASCHCGAVKVTIPAKPAFINECNCSLCMKHGATWGYFKRSEMLVSGDGSTSYVHAGMADPFVRLHFCATCGCTTHCFALDEASDWACVNTRLFAPAEMAGAAVRHPDGRNGVR